MKKTVSGSVTAAVAAALALAGCQAPPVGGDAPAPPRRTASATVALGDGAAAGHRDALRRLRRVEATPSTLAPAKALAEAGDHAGAAKAYEEAYRTTPRGRQAEEALYGAAEEHFLANEHYKALELFERLLVLYPTTPHYPDVLNRQFQIGKLYVEEKAKKPSWFIGVDKTDASYGIEVLERFVKLRDQHENAPEALYLVGEAHVNADEPELAIEAWQRLVKEYPRSAWARLGEYRIALAFISLSYGVEYDKRPLVTGLKRLKAYCAKYQTGDNYQEAVQKRKELEELLAQHELGIAKGYARRDRFRAAQIYLAYIRKEYPETKAATEAKALAAEWENPADPPAPDESK